MEARLLVLSPDDRDRLLAPAVEGVRRRLPEAAALLARLAQLNPALAAQLRPKQDALTDLTLRLLLPADAPALAPVPVPVPSFIVISYCWHYAAWTPAPAAQPLHPRWRISVPMVEAILGERPAVNGSDAALGPIRAPGEGVWFDQLCIDQTNVEEKVVAIGAMDVLYRAARRLVIVLEDVQLEADEEASARAYAGFYADMCTEVRERALEGDARGAFIDGYFAAREAALPAATRARLEAAALPAVQRILGARWVSRAWCVHESRVVVHGKVDNPLFLCFGSTGAVCAFEFRFVHYWALRLTTTDPTPLPTGAQFYAFLDDPNPQTLYQRYHRLQRCLNRPTARMPYTQHLVQVLSARCALEEDLVSIALNTAGLPLAYDGHLARRSDVVWTFGAIALAAGDASPLLLPGRPLPVATADGGDDGVSWMLWPAAGVVDEAPLPPDAAASITGVTGAYIELDLFVLAGQPLKPTAASMARAADLLELIPDDSEADAADADGARARFADTMDKVARMLQGMASPAAAAAAAAGRPSGPVPRLLRVFSQTFLALGLDCGLAWLARFPDVLLAHTQPPGWVLGPLGAAADEQRCGAAADALLAGFGVDPSGTAAAADSDGTPISRTAVVRFLTAVLDDRLKGFTISPRRVQTAADDWAITTSGADRSWLAVPVAVATLPHCHKRVWYVDPFDPAAPPERPEDYLPGPYATRTPLRSSDDGDGRAPATSTWRVRQRHELFGHQRPLAADGQHVRRVARQRVYGAVDYDWKATTAAYRAMDAAREAAAAAAAARRTTA